MVTNTLTVKDQHQQSFKVYYGEGLRLVIRIESGVTSRNRTYMAVALHKVLYQVYKTNDA